MNTSSRAPRHDRAHVAIVGCGYVGAAVAQRLAASGHQVTALRRTLPQAAQPHPSPANVTWRSGDILTPSSLEALGDAAAIVYAVSPNDASDAAYHATYVAGLQNVLSAAPSARVLLVSSTSVYAQTHGEAVDDATPAQAPSAAAAHILTGERAVLDAGQRNLVVRASGIYGPGRTSLLQRVRSGAARTPARPVITNRIHRDDLAAALTFLFERPDESGVVLASNLSPASLAEVQDWLAAQLNVAPPPPAEADAPVRARHLRSKRCLPERLRTLGFTWSYPSYREGYRALLPEA